MCRFSALMSSSFSRVDFFSTVYSVQIHQDYQALQDHKTVINIVDAVVAETKVFRSRRNEERDGAKVTLGGNAFHARAPATGNGRSPSEDRRVAGTTTSVLEAERSLWRERILDTSLKSSDKYSGPRPCRQRYTRTQSLKFTHPGTDSQ